MALPVTDLLVEDCAAGLAAGGWRYTQRQLYYATCARAETRPSDAASNGEIGLGVLFILVGLILVGIKVAFALLVTLGVALVLAGFFGRMRRPRLTGRLLALSFDEFVSRFGSLDIIGVLPTDAVPPAPHAGARTLIVGDTPETAAMIAANIDRAALTDAAVVVANDRELAERGMTVIVLHDASPRGCALVQDLRDAGVEVVDAGIRPRDVDGPAHQVLEGAPARLPRDLAGLLDREELDWLLSGRRVELATLPPEVALDRVRAAISRSEPLHDDAPTPAR